jgi:ATP-dependent Clp protease protease subunit
MKRKHFKLNNDINDSIPKKKLDEGFEIALPFPMMGGSHGFADHTLEENGIIFINEEISKDSLSYASTKLLAYHYDTSFDKPIQIIINSPGGYTDAGWAFIDLMRYVRNKIITIAVGEIASMATYIFVAGDERVMAPNSSAMIHQFSSGVHGKYGDLLAWNRAWEIEHKKASNLLLDTSKYKNQKDIEKYLLKGTDHFLTPTEMKSHGLCDRIASNKPAKRKVNE